MINSKFIKTEIIINKILELESLRQEATTYTEIRTMIDAQIFILKEVLKPQ